MSLRRLPAAHDARRMAVLFFAVVTLGLVAAGYFYYQATADLIRIEKYQELATVGELKASQIQGWLQERSMDARGLARSPFFRKGVQEFLRQPEDANLRADIRERLQLEQAAGEYKNVVLFTPAGDFLLASKDDSNSSNQNRPSLRRTIAAAGTNQEAVVSDFYRNHKGEVCLDVVAALRDTGGQPFAVIVLRSDPDNYLFPMLQSWPAPSPSGETVISQQEGAEIVLVNALRHATNAPMGLRFPLTRTNLPAVQAALGKRGLCEGIDYRGQAVLADLRPIARTPWIIVTKMDKEEIFAGVHEQVSIVSASVGMLILLTAMALAYFYRRRQAGIFLNLYEAKQREWQAQESHRATLYSIGDGVITTDNTGRVREMNPVAEKLTGWTEAAARGKPLEEIFRIVNETTRETLNPVQTVLRENKAVSLSNHALLLARDGTEHPVADSAAPIHAADGSINGVVLVFSDQTRQRTAQRALQESESFLREAQTIAALGNYVLDVSTGQWISSDVLDKVFGIDKAYERSMEGWAALIHPDDRTMMWDYFKNEVLGQKQEFNKEYRIIRQDDQAERWVHGLGHLECDAAGHVLKMRGTIQDITQRRQAAAALSELNRRFRKLLEQVDLAAILLDNQGGVTFCNDYLLRITGWERKEMLGQNWFEKFVPDRKVVSEIILKGIREDRLPPHHENTIFTRDGQQRLIAWNNLLLRDLQGKVVGSASLGEDITARRLTEKAMRKSEEKYRSLFETARDAIMILEPPDWRFTAGNPATVKIFGARDEAEFTSFRPDQLSPERQPDGRTSASKAREMIETAMREGFHTFEWMHQRISGAEFPADVFLTRMEHDGKVKLQATVRDLTERKRAEAALQCSNRLYATLSQVNEIIARVKEREELFAAICRVTVEAGGFRMAWIGLVDEQSGQLKPVCHAGYEEEYLQKVTITHSPENPLGRGPTGLAIRLGKIFVNNDTRSNLEMRPWREEALKRGYLSSAAVPFSCQGKAIGALTFYATELAFFTEAEQHLLKQISQNITFALDALDALAAGEKAQKRLRLESAALEAAANAIIITDAQGTIEWVNSAFTTATGYSFAEAIGKNPRLLQSGEHEPAFYKNLWNTIRAGNVWRGEIINKHKDGHLCTEEMTVTPLKDERGAITHFIAVKQDITQRKSLEAQLRQSQKMDAFGQLAGGVAHDFNNIMATIQLNAELLLMGMPEAEAQESLQQVANATKRAAGLTRQLLLFSRKQFLQLCDLDLSEVVANTTKMLQRILGEDVAIQLKLSPHPLLIHADAGMIDQILMNLTVNARDAMPKGGTLSIETSVVELDEVTAAQSAQARPGSFACLSVTDTGCGIPPEIISRIFEPFFTTKDVGKGTGLGLATVFGIVQQHHGWINVYSEVGRGTTLRVYLPRLDAPLDKPGQGTTLASIRGGNETILLVEDEELVRATLQMALSHLGYHILEAASGAEALAIWQQHRAKIQLLLTDLVMPGGLNGIELARQLLQQEPKLKVIYASGYSGDTVDKDLQLKEGVNFLHKPFETRQLAQTVRNCLDKN